MLSRSDPIFELCGTFYDRKHRCVYDDVLVNSEISDNILKEYRGREKSDKYVFVDFLIFNVALRLNRRVWIRHNWRESFKNS